MPRSRDGCEARGRSIRRGLELALIAIAAAAQSGCGTMFWGTSQTVTVTSEPPGATVVVYPTMERFSTPAEIEVRRKGHYTLRVLRDGYAPEAIFLDRLYNEERAILDAFVSMLPTAGLGPFVDMATGALLEQLPEDTHLVLEPVPESP